MEANNEISMQIDTIDSNFPIFPACIQEISREFETDPKAVDSCLMNEYKNYSETYENLPSTKSTNHLISPKENMCLVSKKTGNKKNQNFAPLFNFRVIKNKSSKGYKVKPLTKEYLAWMLINEHKKVHREILQADQNLINKNSKILLCDFNQNDQNGNYLWNILKNHVITNKIVLEEKSKKYESGRKECPKSFNNGIIVKYFQDEATKKSFYYFIDLIFLELDEQKLYEKFNFICCELVYHSDKCRENWIKLKNYLQMTMFTDLNINPWIPEVESIDFLSQFSQMDVENDNGLIYNSNDEFVDINFEEKDEIAI